MSVPCVRVIITGKYFLSSSFRYDEMFYLTKDPRVFLTGDFKNEKSATTRKDKKMK